MKSSPEYRIRILAALLLLAALPLRGQTTSTGTPAPAAPIAAQSTSAAAPAALAAVASADAPAATQKHAAPFALTSAAALPSPAPAQPELQLGDPQTLHLIVGRSLFIDLPEKLRRVYVSNPAGAGRA